jgi:hypothetical protein
MTVEFVDGLADVVVIGPTARLDFFVLRPNPRAERKDGERPELIRTPALAVSIPLDGFANAIGILEGVRAGLVKSGALKMRDAEDQQEHTEMERVTPNFKIRPN